MPPLTLGFNQGLVTARDRAMLKIGELQTATGIWYKPGDTERAWKLQGRSTFGDVGTAAIIKGLALCQFDTGGTDKLVALSGTALYGATPGDTGTWASLATGLNSSATYLTKAHDADKWYLGDGYDRNRVLKSDGTVRTHGMVSPQTTPLVVSSSATPSVTRPVTSATSGFSNKANAHDSDAATFASSTLSAAATNTLTLSAWATSVVANRTLSVIWSLAGMQSATNDGSDVGVGGSTSSDYSVNVKIEVATSSILGVPTYTTVYNQAHSAATNSRTYSEAVTVDSDEVYVKVSHTYNSGTSTSTLRVYDVKIVEGASVADFDCTTGLYYAITELDENEGIRSAPGPSSILEVMSSENVVTVSLPSAAQNTNTTHWEIWRTFDGGVYPNDLYLVATVPVAATSWRDDFTIGHTEVGATSIPLVPITDSAGSTLYFPRDTSPPAASHLNYYKGSLIILSRTAPRSAWYTQPGYPDSVPEINVFTSFPMPERDELVASVTVGDVLLFAAKGLMMTVNDLPRVVQGVFDTSQISPLRGQPGCVGPDAITTFSVAGEPRAAWVSPFGIHVTNGYQSYRLTTELDWPSTVSVANLATAFLHWDSERYLLIFGYDSDGDALNDSWLAFHMSPEHMKDQTTPKITGPHYGDIRCMASGMVSNAYKLWSGHVSNGYVYLEDSGTTDTSQSYSSTTLPMIVKTGRIYGDWRFLSVYRGNLRHTDFGASQTVTLAAQLGFDASGTSDTVSQSVSLTSQLGTEFFVGRAGEWMEYTLTHTGSATGALLDMRLDARPMGAAGRVAT